MKKKFLLAFCVCVCAHLFLTATTWAATYYISPGGSDTLGAGTTLSPWASLTKAFSVMAGGDILIIRDGTYSGAQNRISSTNRPPAGSPAYYTILKAEHDGEVLFDGENTLYMFTHDGASPAEKYWQFEGIIWGRDAGCNVSLSGVCHVKFLRCGAFDAGNGNTMNFVVNRFSSHVLFENCYAWGSGRFKFSAYQNHHIIFRSCVGRNDRMDGRHGGATEPISTFAFYSVSSGTAQNCIAIDCDQQDSYIGVENGGWAGCLSCPSTDMGAFNCIYNRCIVLNSRIGAVSTSQQSFTSENVKFIDSVFWDINTYPGDYSLFLFRGSNSAMTNCTIGACTNQYWAINSYDSEGNNDTIFRDNIVCNISNALRASGFIYDVELQDYNVYWNCMTRNNSGVHDIANTNPIWSSTNQNGAIKYLVRNESDSTLSDKGSTGGPVGATCLKMIGTPGTMWGEDGYDVEQATDMWPFPNEALMRSKMRTYTGGGVNGARGFCSDGQSLTKYIWGYLGNPVPSELTRALEGEVENSRGLGVTGVSMVISDGISDTASTDSSGAYAFAGLTPGSDYTITPVKEGYTFSPPSRTVSNFSGTLTGLNFTASGLGVEDVVQPQELRVVGSAAQQGTVNPTKGDTAKIYFRGTTTGTYECRIFNINRVMVWQDKEEGTNMGIFEWFPKDMPSGAYIVNVQGPGYNLTKKFAVLK